MWHSDNKENDMCDKDIKEEFMKRRDELNEIVMEYADLPLKRFYSVDSQAYREGALPERTKELLGLTASLVLRCDDCIEYHLIRCREEGITSEELTEALTIGSIVGGTITIPHLRRALELWDKMESEPED